MPGFVDVTHMSDQEIKRLGQMDDYDEEPGQHTRTWQPRARAQGIKHSVDNVWGAAVAAQRINGSYVKETVQVYDDIARAYTVINRRNRDIMTDILANPALITVEDIAQAQECRKFLQNDFTFRALKGRLTDFDSAISKVLAVSEEFDSVTHKYELAVVASLPASHQRALDRQTLQERVRQTSGALIGQLGDKVQLGVEIVKSNYSQQWNTWYATGITADNCAVYFAYRQELARGAKHTIVGTVKAHRDGTTQLNRVVIK